MTVSCKAVKRIETTHVNGPTVTLECWLEEGAAHEKGHYDWWNGIYWRPDTGDAAGDGRGNVPPGCSPDHAIPEGARIPAGGSLGMVPA
jgi:hypothetical protein